MLFYWLGVFLFLINTRRENQQLLTSVVRVAAMHRKSELASIQRGKHGEQWIPASFFFLIYFLFHLKTLILCILLDLLFMLLFRTSLSIFKNFDVTYRQRFYLKFLLLFDLSCFLYMNFNFFVIFFVLFWFFQTSLILIYKLSFFIRCPLNYVSLDNSAWTQDSFVPNVFFLWLVGLVVTRVKYSSIKKTFNSPTDHRMQVALARPPSARFQINGIFCTQSRACFHTTPFDLYLSFLYPTINNHHAFIPCSLSFL